MAVFAMDLNRVLSSFCLFLLQLLGKKQPWQQFPLVFNRQGMSVIDLAECNLVLLLFPVMNFCPFDNL